MNNHAMQKVETMKTKESHGREAGKNRFAYSIDHLSASAPGKLSA